MALMKVEKQRHSKIFPNFRTKNREDDEKRICMHLVGNNDTGCKRE